MIKRKPKDLKSRRRAVQVMEEIGTKDYCKGVLKQTEEAIKKEMTLIGCNSMMDKLMNGLRDWERSS